MVFVNETLLMELPDVETATVFCELPLTMPVKFASDVAEKTISLAIAASPMILLSTIEGPPTDLIAMKLREPDQLKINLESS